MSEKITKEVAKVDEERQRQRSLGICGGPVIMMADVIGDLSMQVLETV